mmetsp:Transcript_10719/g.18388  ORF Transcript_10719/g.18388 Transcript_10719/m.18388 type:complete len:419 (+) Transcript_10719:407-1663(+)
MVKLAFKPHLVVWLQYKRAVRIISVRLLGMRASLVEKQLSTQFEVPCTLEYFSSYWGIENIQLYLWILKDLAWMQADFVLGYFSAVVIVLGMVLVYMARTSRVELVQAIASFLWILGNWWWMIGENWNHRFHESDEKLHAHELQSRYLLLGAFSMSATYYFVHLPCKKVRGYINYRLHHPQAVPEDLEPEKDPILVPDVFPVRFPLLFDDWRDWANLEVLFWAGKDLFWNLGWRVPWAMCAVATLMHTADMLYVTWPLRIENNHKWAQLIWVTANAMWAYGELFEPFKDHSGPQTETLAPSDWRNLRWWAFWYLWLAFVPIISLYASWIPVTIHADGQCACCQSRDDDEILTTIEASMSMAMDEGHPLDVNDFNDPLLLKSEPLDDKEEFLFCFHSLDETSECFAIVNREESVEDVEV